jgi:Serpin (serine protease inhibitor)
MSIQTSQVADCVSRYARRLHAVIGSGHHVASPLGAWLLLALAAPASTGPDRGTLTEVLGCDIGEAAGAAAELLASPHPLVASAAAIWTARQAQFTREFARWRERLPAEVTTGDLPGQAALNAWVREHTFGLIDRFPIQDDSLYLVLASVLATKVSWQTPFALAPAASLGAASPWASRLDRVLRTPPRPRGHVQFIAITPEAGEVIAHIATAAGGLCVISVAAGPEVPAGDVLAAAHDLGRRYAAGLQVDRRDLADLPIGEAPLWVVREVTATADSCIAVLPAWSARSDHNLTNPVLGFTAVKDALAPGADPWQARQSALARYSRTGFEAAAATAIGIALAARMPGKHREVELRFAQPYAAVAIATAPDGPGGPAGADANPWHGLPVFSAWVIDPENPADDPPPRNAEPARAAGASRGSRP